MLKFEGPGFKNVDSRVISCLKWSLRTIKPYSDNQIGLETAFLKLGPSNLSMFIITQFPKTNISKVFHFEHFQFLALFSA